METLKIDFTIDVITNERIPLEQMKVEIKKVMPRQSYYFSELADFYYKTVYKKNILQVLKDYYSIPLCPITGELVSYKLAGSILFGKYSSSCSFTQISKYIAENNENYKIHVEKMKTDRLGAGNPMYNKIPWNNGLTKDTDDRVNEVSKKMIGNKPSKEALDKMSESAKKRKVHGHTGHKHSEYSKSIMREKTIARFKAGSFPQTNTLPHKMVREILIKLSTEECEFVEEFACGGFVFDFKIGNNLIEVQGDYFHCNPNTRHAVPKNKMQVNNLKRDERKRKFVKDNTDFVLVEIWEKDIIEETEKVEICLKNLMK